MEKEIIDFATWYSGMERKKVERAYQRYLREEKPETTSANSLHKHVVNAHFSSENELRTFIQMHLPIAVRPTKPAKTIFVSPFTSHNAEKVVVDSLVESFLNAR